MSSVLSRSERALPDALPAFAHIQRRWDSTLNCCASKILPGEYYVTLHDEAITTVLGSCVSACVRDPATGVGGMNHFMLPGETGRRMDRWGGDDCLMSRYGVAAMEMLINDILKLGAQKQRLELKFFGGGKVLAMEANNIGERNVDFVRQFMRTEGLSIAAEDLGGTFPRKVNYFPKTGRAMVRRLRSLQNNAIVAREQSYCSSLDKRPVSDDIDLFD